MASDEKSFFVGIDSADAVMTAYRERAKSQFLSGRPMMIAPSALNSSVDRVAMAHIARGVTGKPAVSPTPAPSLSMSVATRRPTPIPQRGKPVARARALDNEKTDDESDAKKNARFIRALKERAANGDETARQMLELAKKMGMLDDDSSDDKPSPKDKDDASRASLRARSSTPSLRTPMSDERKLEIVVTNLRALCRDGNEEARAQLGYLQSIGVVDVSHAYVPPKLRASRAQARAQLRRDMGLDAGVIGIRRDHRGRNEYGCVYESENISKVTR